MRPGNLHVWASVMLAAALALLISVSSQATVAERPVVIEPAAGPSTQAVEPERRGLISYLSVAGALSGGGLAVPERSLAEPCGEDAHTAPPEGLQKVRCTLPPGSEPPVASPSPPQTPPNASEPPAEPAVPTGSSQPAPSPTPPQQAVDPGFKYNAPGMLADRDASAKRGRPDDRKIYAPDIVFPIRLENGRFASMNSQIWGYGGGGYNGVGEAGGTECDPRNYDPMHQRDNFCEVRSWSMPLCPGGQGHQGQDIRPPSCKDNTWDVVAVADGVITLVTSNTTVKLKGSDGTVYEYLHMHPNSIRVKEGNKVKQGDVLGRVSKYMNGTRSTTYHLHFNIRQRIQVGGKVLEVYVPPYASLIAAYRKAKGVDPGIGADGDLVVDPNLEIGAVAQAPPASTRSEPAPSPSAPPAPAPSSPAPTPSEPAPAPAPSSPPAPSEPAPAPTPSPSAPSEPAPPPTPTSPSEPAPAPPSSPTAPTTPPPAPAVPPAPPAPEPPSAPPAPPPAPSAPQPPDPAPPPAPSAPPSPAPASPPSEQQKSLWQRGIDQATELWRRWWK